MGAPEDLPAPVFVGGSPRAGTHAMGRLVAAGPSYELLRVEARFHASDGGLPDVLAGRVGVDEFVERCLGDWWRRGLRGTGGLQLLVERPRFEQALERFRAACDRDPLEAGRRLVADVADPAAERAGKPAWVDVTGPNVGSAPTLLELFPHARFIHMVRDGRAVVASMLKKTGMTDDPAEALEIWEGRVRAAAAAIRSLPAGVILTVNLDDLVAADREASFRAVVEFLAVGDDSGMRRHFDEQISGESAHFGRWRERMAPAEGRWLDRRYRRLVRALHRDGVSWAPTPEGGLRPGNVPVLPRSH